MDAQLSSGETEVDLPPRASSAGAVSELVGDPFVRALEEPGLRLKLPASIAEVIGDVVMALCFDGGRSKWLAVIPLARWRQMLDAELAARGQARVDRQALLRRLARDAARVDVSRDGRLTLPKNLAARCDLANEVTVWPRVDRLEIVAGRKLPSKADDERIEDVYRGFRKEVFD